MELLLAILIGLLFGCGTYLILSRRLLRVVFGTALLSHASLLFLITMGKHIPNQNVPIVSNAGGPYSDPLPQALILTAIVIGFAVTAFSIVLAYRTYQEAGTDDLESDDLRGIEEAKHD